MSQFGGFHSHGGTPIAGRLISWKIPSRNGSWLGVPLFGKPPYVETIKTYSVCFMWDKKLLGKQCVLIWYEYVINTYWGCLDSDTIYWGYSMYQYDMNIWIGSGLLNLWYQLLRIFTRISRIWISEYVIFNRSCFQVTWNKSPLWQKVTNPEARTAFGHWGYPNLGWFRFSSHEAPRW